MCLYFSTKGQSLVELSFLLPVFVILLLAIFLIAEYFDLQISLDMAVAQALRAESMGYDGRKVFFQEWKNLTGKDGQSVEFRLSRNVHVVTVSASTEVELPAVFKNFNMANPKIHSKLTQILVLTRI